MASFSIEAVLNHPRTRVFELFVVPRNMLKFMPPAVTITVDEAPLRATTGSEIRLSVAAMGFSQKIRLLIVDVEEGRRLADRQVEGPFKVWEQTHTFVDDGPGRTLVRREVNLVPPGGILGMFLTEARIRSGFEDLSRKQFAEIDAYLAGS